MDPTEEFSRQFDGEQYVYPTGHWFKIEIKQVRATPRRPAGIKYSLAFFDSEDNCLVRFDNSHGVTIHGRTGPVPFDHWHRFGDGALVPYTFVDLQSLVDDFFKAIDAHLPPELHSSA